VPLGRVARGEQCPVPPTPSAAAPAAPRSATPATHSSAAPTHPARTRTDPVADQPVRFSGLPLQPSRSSGALLSTDHFGTLLPAPGTGQRTTDLSSPTPPRQTFTPPTTSPNDPAPRRHHAGDHHPQRDNVQHHPRTDGHGRGPDADRRPGPERRRRPVPLTRPGPGQRRRWWPASTGAMVRRLPDRCDRWSGRLRGARTAHYARAGNFAWWSVSRCRRRLDPGQQCGPGAPLAQADARLRAGRARSCRSGVGVERACFPLAPYSGARVGAAAGAISGSQHFAPSWPAVAPRLRGSGGGTGVVLPNRAAAASRLRLARQ